MSRIIFRNNFVIFTSSKNAYFQTNDCLYLYFPKAALKQCKRSMKDVHFKAIFRKGIVLIAISTFFVISF